MTTEIKVPDIGDFKDVPVIEIHVKPGDTVKAEDPLVTLESDKATMDVPSPVAGVVETVRVKIGDKVSEGSVVVLLEAQGATPPAPAGRGVGAKGSLPAPAGRSAGGEDSLPSPPGRGAGGEGASPPPAPLPAQSVPATPLATRSEHADHRPNEDEPTQAPPVLHMPTPEEMTRQNGGTTHASPSVRRFARELGVDIAAVRGSGDKGRILHSDIQAYVKGVLNGATTATNTAGAAGAVGGGLNLLPWPQTDFAKFGPIERKPLSRIKKISGPNLARNWVMIPAVTYHEDADITELEALRVSLNKENEKSGMKITMLAFLIKACVAALKKYPELNASLDGDDLVYKNYWHIGFAADTPNGLMVPVLKNADQKGVLQISAELADLSKKARDGKLGPAEMQGATFTISSLGGIGGTYFSPIVNAPEVAILGVNKAAMKPVWDGKAFIPRLTLPLSLSADHRVIDGALATRFSAYLATLLADFRRTIL